MKMNLAIIGLAFTSYACSAQTITTNWVTAAPNFREVNGKLYNTEKSILWSSLSGQCASTSPDGIVLQMFTNRNTYQMVYDPGNGAPAGSFGARSAGMRRHLVSSEPVPSKRIFVTNAANFAEGQEISMRAMRIGTKKYNDATLELWDCGKPHVVAVVRTNSIPTNAPSK